MIPEADLEKRVREAEAAIAVLQATFSSHATLTNEKFAAAKEAIIKAETAQAEYNKLHNDLVRKNELMITRTTFDDEKVHVEGRIIAVKNDNAKEIAEIKQDIRSLRESRSESGGKGSGVNAAWGYLLGLAGLAAIVVSLVTR